MSATTRTYFR